MQNFSASIRKPGRQAPAQTSGRELDGEVRMLVEGESTLIVDWTTHTIPADDGKNYTLQVHVIVYDPETGKELFNQRLYHEKYE